MKFKTSTDLLAIAGTTAITWTVEPWVAESPYESIDITAIIESLRGSGDFRGDICIRLTTSSGSRVAYGVLHGTPELQLTLDALSQEVGLGASIQTLNSTLPNTGVAVNAIMTTLTDECRAYLDMGAIINSGLEVFSGDDTLVDVSATIESLVEALWGNDARLDAAITLSLGRAITSSIGLTASITGTVTTFPIEVTVTSSMLMYDQSGFGWRVTTSDPLQLTDSVDKILGIPVDDWITIVDSQSNNWRGREIIADGVMVWDISGLGKIYLDSLTAPLVLTDTSTLKLTVTILDYLGFDELAKGIISCTLVNNSSLVLTDSSLLSLPQSVSDILNLVDTNAIIALFTNAINEALGLTDTNSLLRTQVVSVTDPLVFVDTISNLGRFYSTIQDTLALDVTVELSGEVWQCYVLNTPKFHPSMYSGFNFNSYCVFENRAYGANDTGIFELTGSTDAGSTIHTGTILSQTDFGLPNQKRFRRGYLGITGTSPVMVFEAEDGTREAFTVDTQGKVVGSSELKSKKWILSIVDYDSLDHLKLIPIILTK